MAEEAQEAVGALFRARVERVDPARRRRRQRGDRRAHVLRREQARQRVDGRLPGVERGARRQAAERVLRRQKAPVERHAVVRRRRRRPRARLVDEQRLRRAPDLAPGVVVRGDARVVVALDAEPRRGPRGVVGLDEVRRHVGVARAGDQERRGGQGSRQRRGRVGLGFVARRAAEVARDGVALVAELRREARGHVRHGRDGHARPGLARALAGLDRERRARGVANDDQNLPRLREQIQRRGDVVLGPGPRRDVARPVLDQSDVEAPVQEEGHEARRLRRRAVPLPLPEAAVDDGDGGVGASGRRVDVDELRRVVAVAQRLRGEAGDERRDARRLAPRRRVGRAAGVRRRVGRRVSPAGDEARGDGAAGSGDAAADARREARARMPQRRVVALAGALRAVREVGVPRDVGGVGVQVDDRADAPAADEGARPGEVRAGGVHDGRAPAKGGDAAVAGGRQTLEVRVDDGDVVLERARRHHLARRQVVDGSRAERRRRQQQLRARDGQVARGLGELDVEADEAARPHGETSRLEVEGLEGSRRAGREDVALPGAPQVDLAVVLREGAARVEDGHGVVEARTAALAVRHREAECVRLGRRGARAELVPPQRRRLELVLRGVVAVQEQFREDEHVHARGGGGGGLVDDARDVRRDVRRLRGALPGRDVQPARREAARQRQQQRDREEA